MKMPKTKIRKNLNPVLYVLSLLTVLALLAWAHGSKLAISPVTFGHKVEAKANPSTKDSVSPSRSNQNGGINRPAAGASPSVKKTSALKTPWYAHISSINTAQKTFVWQGKTYPLRTYKPLSLPNDTYANQWWASSTGMSTAWSVPTGPNQVKTAIIDTGFALNHQEFSGRWATNSGEIGTTTQENPSKLNCTDRGLALNKSCNLIDDDQDGIVDNESGSTTQENPSQLNCTDQGKALDKSCNLRDDDSNGKVDDWRGWDFSNWDNSPQAGEVNPDGSGTEHGTMTAGTLGATGNNGVGIAGVNWNTKILPLQALDDDGYGDSVTVGEAVYYAVDQGADVISISLGTSSDDPYLRGAILYAMAHDVIVVAAAGNDGCDCLSYPANYPEVVAVGAEDPSGQLASFSSYGANLDITAPGENMTLPVWSKSNGTSAYASGAAGTSFSTPFVAGLLGLMKSYQPNATWDELTGVLFESSDRRTLTASSPHSNSFGFGFIQASSALNRAYQTFQPVTTYGFSGPIVGSGLMKVCDSGILPGSYLYELTKGGSIEYTINQYEKRQAETGGWVSKQLFGVCVGLPTDSPDFMRSISLSQELLNMQIKQ